jgi:spore coat polysaccharide biosynthesis protein SpsF
MKTVAIIQARMGSSRLPGKVMLDLCGKTVLAHVIERVKAGGVEVIVATSDKLVDDVVAAEAKKNGAKVFRGSEDDVLSRYYYAARQAGAELIVRVTGDCPLYDGRLLADMLKYYKGEAKNCDFLANTMERRFPRGLDTEILTFEALEKCFNGAKEAFQREHVTTYIYQNPGLFKIRHYRRQPDLSHLRWTLDTIEDWQMIKSVYAALYRPGSKNPIFSTAKVVNYLAQHPEIAKLNAHIEQKQL